jgi:hypothetical protein
MRMLDCKPNRIKFPKNQAGQFARRATHFSLPRHPDKSGHRRPVADLASPIGRRINAGRLHHRGCGGCRHRRAPCRTIHSFERGPWQRGACFTVLVQRCERRCRALSAVQRCAGGSPARRDPTGVVLPARRARSRAGIGWGSVARQLWTRTLAHSIFCTVRC